MRSARVSNIQFKHSLPNKPLAGTKWGQYVLFVRNVFSNVANLIKPATAATGGRVKKAGVKLWLTGIFFHACHFCSIKTDMQKTNSTNSTACVIFVEAVSIFW